VLRKIVVVGASLAGLRAVEALRAEGFDGELSLVGKEPHLPYDRPPLSKQVLSGELDAARTRLRGADDLGSLAVDVRLGSAARALDAARRVLVLADGSELAYDGVLIATGAAARALPQGRGLRGVHVLRSLDDALAIRDALRGGPRVCVIGAGFIGLEVAASCRKLGLAVDVVEPLPLPLVGKLGSRMAREALALHERHGVRFHCGAAVSDVQGGERVERVLLADGRALPADLVVVGIGVTPEVEWLRGSGVQLERGVVCDATCATALPDVVAAGDCARWFDPRRGEIAHVEHWTHAVEMANHAARRLLGGSAFTEAFSPVPYFWSDQYDVKMQFAGAAREDDALELVEYAPHAGKLVALYGRGDRLVGALTWNRPAQLIRYRRQIAEGAAFDAVVSQARAASA
jgi:NADPH-dependent 2,4-dienoyl-CoA reductase/sulfur reductase-like enzyme